MELAPEAVTAFAFGAQRSLRTAAAALSLLDGLCLCVLGPGAVSLREVGTLTWLSLCGVGALGGASM